MSKTQEQSLFTSEEYQATFKKNKNSKSEQKIQVEFCDYLKKTYPDLIFTCDLASGMNLGKWIGGMNTRLRSSRALPDITIYESKTKHYDVDDNGNGGSFKTFYGLVIELKKEGTELKRKKDGVKLVKGDYKIRKAGDWYDLHIEEQALILDRMRKKGYFAEFAVGIEEAKKLIDDYLQ